MTVIKQYRVTPEEEAAFQKWVEEMFYIGQDEGDPFPDVPDPEEDPKSAYWTKEDDLAPEIKVDQWVIDALQDANNGPSSASEAKALDTDADPSPKPSAARLRRYWVSGPGAAKIGWGKDGDFYRCVAQLGKYVEDPKGLCNVYHRSALGAAPGQGHKADDLELERKTMIPVELKTVYARSLDLAEITEQKGIRRVRTRAGALFFRQPIGSIIVNDSRMENLTIKKPVFAGFDTVEGSNGKMYDLGKDDDGDWVAFHHDSNRTYVTAENEEDLFNKVNAKIGKGGSGRRKKEPATPPEEVRGGEELARMHFREDRVRFMDADTGKRVTGEVIRSGKKRKGRQSQEYVVVSTPNGERTFWEEDFDDVQLTKIGATLKAPEAAKVPNKPEKRGLFRGRPTGQASQASIDDYERNGKFGTADPQEAFRLEMHKRGWMNTQRLEAIADSERYREDLATATFTSADDIKKFAKQEHTRLKREQRQSAGELAASATRAAGDIVTKPVRARQARERAERLANTEQRARAEQAAKPKTPKVERTPDAYGGRFGNDEFGTVAREKDSVPVRMASNAPLTPQQVHNTLVERYNALPLATLNRNIKELEQQMVIARLSNISTTGIEQVLKALRAARAGKAS